MPSRESSVRNLEKARAHWQHPPRPWRSDQESRVIRRLVWQWFRYRGPEKSSGRAVGRWLGVSHTYIQKLLREFGTDPSRALWQEQTHGPATIDDLKRAQAHTWEMKQRGCLRSPPRWRRVEFKVSGCVYRTFVPTKASTRPATGHGAAPQDVNAWAGPVWISGPATGPQFPTRAHFRRRWRPGMP